MKIIKTAKYKKISGLIPLGGGGHGININKYQKQYGEALEMMNLSSEEKEFLGRDSSELRHTGYSYVKDKGSSDHVEQAEAMYHNIFDIMNGSSTMMKGLFDSPNLTTENIEEMKNIFKQDAEEKMKTPEFKIIDSLLLKMKNSQQPTWKIRGEEAYQSGHNNKCLKDFTWIQQMLSR